VQGLVGSYAFECHDDQGRPSLCLTEVREGEIEDYYIAFYKFAQAASSSGVSQSLAKDDAAASIGIVVSVCASLSDRKNASSLSDLPGILYQFDREYNPGRRPGVKA